MNDLAIDVTGVPLVIGSPINPILCGLKEASLGTMRYSVPCAHKSEWLMRLKKLEGDDAFA